MSVGITQRIRATRALRTRPFALLWSGQTISALGDGAYTPALAWQALVLTHSSTALALLSWTGVLQLWHLIVLGAIFGVVGAFFLPAYRAMPPLLVTREAPTR